MIMKNNNYIKLSEVYCIDFLEAQQKIREVMQKSKYIHMRVADDQNHRDTFVYDIGNGFNLQLSVTYCDSYADALLFIDPIVANQSSFTETLRFINAVNWFCKALGRFYIDDDLDIAYSFRIPYELMDAKDGIFLIEAEAGIGFYLDLLPLLLELASAEITSDQAIYELDTLWRS